MTNKNNFPFRTDESLIEKLKTIADKEGRSANKQLEYILKKYVEEYETKEKREQERTELKGKLSDSLIG